MLPIFAETGLVVTELGLGTVFCFPYSGASFLLLWDEAGVIPVRSCGTPNRGEVTMGRWFCGFRPKLRSGLRLGLGLRC